MPSSSSFVPPYGPRNSRWMVIGEAPGKDEYLQGKPFVGAAGQEQQSLLRRNGLLQSSFRLANIYPIFQPGNPDPTPDQIDQYTPDLIREIHTTNPLLIIAVGRISIRWLLGDSAELEEVHGVPHPCGHFDPSRSSRAPSTCTILPVTHPAAAFYDETGRARAVIDYDYRRAAEAIRRLKLGEDLSDDYPIDHYAGWIERYEDVTGSQLRKLIRDTQRTEPDLLLHQGIDTEKLERDSWIQVSWEPGTGYVLRSCQSDFNEGVRELQRLVHSGSEVITHDADTPSGCLYDMSECRKMGLELRRAKLFNTMYNLSLYRGEPKGLKPASYRFCGMRMTPYEDLLGSIARDKQISYLEKVLAHSSLWPGKERHLVYDNDGTSRYYSPNSISASVDKILSDIRSGKMDKDGNLTDPFDRWYSLAKKEKLGDYLRKPVEDRLGPMPIATLDDVPLKDAIRYAAIDADATRRLSFKCKERNKREGLEETMRKAMLTIPNFEEMQWNGMPTSKPHLISLRDRMQEKMDTFQTKLSLEYFGGEPFNPASNPQTVDLLRRRGLMPGKTTKLTGKPSASKKSIEHYRYKDPAIGLLFDWREHLKIRSFCNIFLGEFIEDEGDVQPIHPTLNIAKTETRRPSSEEPNLLNVPVRTEIGRAVRACFIAPEGYLMVGGDLSQIELRCLADDSRSKLLINIFLADRDPHGEIGTMVFGKPRPPADAPKEEREKWEYEVRLPAKTTDFGIVYGQQKYGLYEQFRTFGLDSYSIDDCEYLRKKILGLLGIEEYIRWVTNEAKRTGCVRDISGMPHYLPNLFNRDDRLRSEAERQVISYRIQSMAQVMIQNSMAHFGPTIWSIQDADIDVLQRLQVYDELICTSPEEYAPMVGSLIIDSLENHSGVKLKVPIKAKAHIGKAWDELK